MCVAMAYLQVRFTNHIPKVGLSLVVNTIHSSAVSPT